MTKNDIAVIVLTYNEELHIERCIRNLKKISNNIYVVDSFSTDKTIDICKELGVSLIQNKWPGNQAQQLNWALDNIDIKNEWILRIDADEYLLPELIDEINLKMCVIPSDVNGIFFKRRLIFMNKWIKRGAYPILFLRFFRRGYAICEERIMDEHMKLISGKSIVFENDFVDHNLNNLNWWILKHLNYADREVIELLKIEYLNNSNEDFLSNNKKKSYIRMPLFLRSFLYFFYRYIIKLGFIEGKKSFIWNFMQGLWYRLLIDIKISEIKSKKSKIEILEYIDIKLKEYNVKE